MVMEVGGGESGDDGGFGTHYWWREKSERGFRVEILMTPQERENCLNTHTSWRKELLFGPTIKFSGWGPD